MPARAMLMLALCCAAGLLPAASAEARPDQITLVQAPRELRSPDPSVRTQALDEIRRLGVRWIRLNLFWHDVAPAAGSARRPPAPRAYDWSHYDAVIGEARARGLRILLTVGGPVPVWATRAQRDTLTRPRPSLFEDFTRAVARRYGDAVGLWSIWNEPNQPAFLKPQIRGGRAVPPRLYRKLFVAGRRGLRRGGERRARILMGETAPFGNRNVVAPLRFLRGALRGRRLRIDGWAHHPYSTSAGPWLVPADRDDVTIGVLGRLTRALNRAGQRRAPVYLTEFGVQSRPDRVLGVPLARQVDFRAIAERIAFRNPRVRAFSQYLLRDDTSLAGFQSGLRFADGRAKPALAGFRLPVAAVRNGPRVRLWGRVRPADGRTRLRVEFRDRGGSWRRLGRERTDHRGVWRRTTRRKRGRTYRVVWRGQRSPAAHVQRRR